MILLLIALLATADPADPSALEKGRVIFTGAMMRTLASAIENYRVDNGSYPPGTESVCEAESVISPLYILHAPRYDGWGSEFHYSASADLQNYRLVSAGADGIFSTTSLDAFDREQPIFSFDAAEDFVIEDGFLVQAPAEVFERFTGQRQ